MNQLQQQLFQAKLHLIGEEQAGLEDGEDPEDLEGVQDAADAHNSEKDRFTDDNPFLGDNPFVDDNPFLVSDTNAQGRARKAVAGKGAGKGKGVAAAAGVADAEAQVSVAVVSEECSYLLPNGRSQESLGVAMEGPADIQAIGSLEDVTGDGPGGDQDSDGVMMGDVVEGVGEEVTGEEGGLVSGRAMSDREGRKARGTRWGKVGHKGGRKAGKGAVRDASQPACGCAMM